MNHKVKKKKMDMDMEKNTDGDFFAAPSRFHWDVLIYRDFYEYLIKELMSLLNTSSV